MSHLAACVREQCLHEVWPVLLSWCRQVFLWRVTLYFLPTDPVPVQLWAPASTIVSLQPIGLVERRDLALVCVYASVSEAWGQNSPSVVVLRKQTEESFPLYWHCFTHPESRTACALFHSISTEEVSRKHIICYSENHSFEKSFWERRQPHGSINHHSGKNLDDLSLQSCDSLMISFFLRASWNIYLKWPELIMQVSIT